MKRRGNQILKKLKKYFRESVSGKIYYNIINIPVIKIFFDFDYASEMWNRSYIKNKTESVLKKTEFMHNFRISGKTDLVVTIFLGSCPFIGLWTGKDWHIIILTLILSLYFVFIMNCIQLKFVLFYEFILTVLFAPFVPLSVLTYVIYVESAITMFFIVKNSEEQRINKIFKIMISLWTLQCFLGSQDGVSLVVAFMPYVLVTVRNRKVWGYVLEIIVLAVGFYALSKSGGEALLGGGVGILTMTVLGEIGLIIPVILVSPWIIGVGIRMIRGGLISENIIRTGYFFWSRSLKGATFNYESVNLDQYGIFVSLVISVIAFIFFWYVLRISRQAVLKLFEKGNKNKKIIRAAIGAITGFSFYTFFSKNGMLKENVLIYLWCVGLLKRACLDMRK